MNDLIFMGCLVTAFIVVAVSIVTKFGLLLLKPQQAAEALSISPRKLWAMTASGEIPHVRLGRCVRYPVDDLQRWIDEQKKGGNA